ncbi:MAG: hypothetical protein QUV05_21155 [Phycisphaerae bacterium]|nr:hypothetical protein [Phycisphaerae bacterium]
MENEKRNPPVQKFRLGQVEAAIWLNRNQNPRTKREETYHSVTVTRGYTDQQGFYRDTTSFNVQHIPLLLKVLEHAYDYVHEMQRQSADGDEYGDASPGGPAPSSVPDDTPVAFLR